MKMIPFALLFALILSAGALAADVAQPPEGQQPVGTEGQLPPAAEPAEPAKPAAEVAEPVPAAAAPVEAEKPVADPAPAATEGQPAAVQQPATQGAPNPEHVDDIDLDEVDDSADAAKRPSVKFAQPEKAQTAPAAAETAPVPAAEAPAAAEPVPAPAAADAQPAPAEEAKPAEQAAPKAATVPAASSEGALVDISCDDATLADILRQFRKTTGANIISGDSTNLMRRVSVNLNHVPWLQALQSILNSRGFRLEPREGIYFVSEDKQLDPLFTRAYSLNHASSEELAKLFNATYATKNAQGVPTQPVATAFPGANVVVVTSTEKILRDCESIIKAVDKPVQQVYIEARFIELSNEAMRKLGMQWDSLSSWGATVKGLSGGWEYNNGRAANYWSRLTSDSTSTSRNSSSSEQDTGATTSLSDSLAVSKSYEGVFASGINAADGANRTANSMAWRNARGFSGQLSVDDFRLALSAFEQLGEGRVFSNPKIIVSNGKEAKVDMTTKYPNVTIDSNFTGQNQNSLSVSTKLDTIPGEDKQMFAKEAFFSWGIMLTVKPRISPDGLINVEIVPTISDVKGYATVQSNQESDTPYTQYPIIEVKRLTTDFTMKDGATAVIGGLSKTTEEDIDSGIPLLRKIPWIGRKLFGWTSRQKVQKEIVVFVTVGIADPAALPTDVGLPKNAVMGREYITGARLEPGDRADAAATFTSLDFRPIDERAPAKAAAEPAAEEAKPGTVVIKMSGSDAEPRPESATSGDGSVTVRRVSAEEKPASPEPAPAAPEKPAPLVNRDTASSVDDLLESK